MAKKSHSLFGGGTIATAIIVIVLGIGAWLQMGTGNSYTTNSNTTINAPKLSDYYDVSDIRYKGKRLVLTKHARCRMGCREIDAFEVKEILDNGRINNRKSEPGAHPCPKYAIEGESRDGQTVRAVIADCNREVKLITVIDLDNHYKCSCK